MELKIKTLKWSAGLPVVILNQKTAEKIGVHPQDRITIKTLSQHPRELSAVTDSIKKIVGFGEIAVSSELSEILGLKSREKVEVNLSEPVVSVDYIRKKMNGHTLNENEINSIVKDIVSNSISEAEIALFVSSINKYGMSLEEIIFLIKSFLKTGNRLSLKNKFIVDKHSIGGIAGNRTTPLVVSICAAAGLIVPKNSSRAITSPAGTADVIETIARVEFSIKEVEKIIRKTNACMIWGGGLGIVPADSKIIRVEKSLKIDPKPMLIASIMSKKIAAGSKYILIDIPYGKGAKVNKKEAIILKRKFEYLGKYFKKKIKCVLTDGSQPIGSGIGPALELRDVIKILNPEEMGPKDLEEKSLFLAGEIFEMTGLSKKGYGKKFAQNILSSGKAYEKFKEIIEAQEGSLKKLRNSKFQRDVLAKKSGKIVQIDNKKINSLARYAGCPADKFSGVYLHKKRGDFIKKKQKIITIYADSISRLRSALSYYEKDAPIRIK